MLDTSAADGQKLDPIVRAEIDFVAPSTIDTGDIHTNMLADLCVTEEKIYPGAVGHVQLALGGIESDNYAAGSVGTAALDDDGVTAAKAGLGTVTAYDYAGNPIESKDVYLTAAQYNLITVPDPNTTYNIVG